MTDDNKPQQLSLLPPPSKCRQTSNKFWKDFNEFKSQQLNYTTLSQQQKTQLSLVFQMHVGDTKNPTLSHGKVPHQSQSQKSTDRQYFSVKYRR